MAAEAVGPTGKVIGIDPAPKMIGLARKNAAFFSNKAEFRLAVIEDLPFDNETFDAVLSSAMIHHLPPDLKHAGLLEVKRVLKPGGRFVVVDLDRPANPLWWFLVWPLLIMPTTCDHLTGRLAPYFTQSGFDPVNRVGRWRGLLSFWMLYKPKK
jgi:ubiquinone/menaquinone biosynthesis C-methylase UbiE